MVLFLYNTVRVEYRDTVLVIFVRNLGIVGMVFLLLSWQVLWCMKFVRI